MEITFIIASVLLLSYIAFRDKLNFKRKNKQANTFLLENTHKIILLENVNFYRALTPKKKELFEYKVSEFLSNCTITGVETEVAIYDKLLIAASAIIPIFSFPNWQYTNLNEVLLYPGSFNENFSTTGQNNNILGMVGTGYMEGKMILSKNALHKGFSITQDKKNTAIHEFVHLIDKMDGETDGIPALFLEQQYLIPWVDLIHKKIEEILDNNSDINPYGATNKAEFFAVIAEYFFERPKLLKRKHPELFKILESIFKQKPDKLELNPAKKELSRNAPCPCGSQLKYKKCCGKN